MLCRILITSPVSLLAAISSQSQSQSLKTLSKHISTTSSSSMQSTLSSPTSSSSLHSIPLPSPTPSPIQSTPSLPPKHFDIIILGAGLSGIAAGQKIKRSHPGKTFTVLEKRDVIGGTWSNFKYPGFRCDSDMYSFAYSFAPWFGEKRVLDGGEMLGYLEGVVNDEGLGDSIIYNCSVKIINFSTSKSRWTLRADNDSDTDTEYEYTADHIISATGYYSYSNPHTPTFPGQETFLKNGGEIVHSQNFDPKIHSTCGKNVVLVGSGATAVTIFPALVNAVDAPVQTTIIQRSPTYILPAPSHRTPSYFTSVLFELPYFGNGFKSAYWRGVKYHEVCLSMYGYYHAKLFPAFTREKVKTMLTELSVNTKKLVEDGHFSPRYDMWSQRVCCARDSDFYEALDKGGRGGIFTGDIAEFVPGGILVEDKSEGVNKGQTEVIKADTVILCTGLKLLFAGGVEIYIDDVKVEVEDECLMYKNCMLTGGYTNASLTVKVELTLTYISRVLSYMDAHGYKRITPLIPTPSQHGQKKNATEFTSSYVTRDGAGLGQPKSGNQWPWKNSNDVFLDLLRLAVLKVDDEGVMLGKGAEEEEKKVRTSG